jgi:16S rRNA (cytosine967-C5)-methyltransferase
VQALSFHVLRWLGSATAVRAGWRPRRRRPMWTRCCHRAGAAVAPGEPPPYAEHTLVDQAVAAARHRTPAAAAFVNAVLRRFLREREALVAAGAAHAGGGLQPPAVVDRAAAPRLAAHWQALLRSANQRPPMTLRINAAAAAAKAYSSGWPRRAAPRTLLRPPTALGGPADVVLDAPCPVQQLPGFAEGELSVQDAAAQRAAPLLLAGLLAAGCRPPGRARARRLRRPRRQDRPPAGTGRRWTCWRWTATRCACAARAGHAAPAGLHRAAAS